MNGEPGTVTVLGLGAMGSALAHALLAAGHLVTAWNRTPARGMALEIVGACLRTDAAEAIADSDIVIACVSDYTATRAILQAPAAGAALRDRLLVQLTSGLPREARTLEVWARAQGAGYLDGAILAYPTGIGAPGCTILYAGHAAAFERGRPVLAALGGNAIWLGPDAGAAAALDDAFLAFYYGATVAWLHGAAICESEGLPVEGFLDAMLPAMPVITETMRAATTAASNARSRCMPRPWPTCGDFRRRTAPGASSPRSSPAISKTPWRWAAPATSCPRYTSGCAHRAAPEPGRWPDPWTSTASIA